jgi:hypothetical protein
MLLLNLTLSWHSFDDINVPKFMLLSLFAMLITLRLYMLIRTCNVHLDNSVATSAIMALALLIRFVCLALSNLYRV